MNVYVKVNSRYYVGATHTEQVKLFDEFVFDALLWFTSKGHNRNIVSKTICKAIETHSAADGKFNLDFHEILNQCEDVLFSKKHAN